MAGCEESILLYGDSGDGKTALIGEFAEDLFIKTGGKKTRLYAGDPGGFRTIQPYVNLGIIDVVDLRGRPYPWEWLDAISKGKVPDNAGRWILDRDRNANIGAWAFEGATAFGDTLLQDAARKAKDGIQVGGQPAPRFVERAAPAAGGGPSSGVVAAASAHGHNNSIDLGSVSAGTSAHNNLRSGEGNASVPGGTGSNGTTPPDVGYVVTGNSPAHYGQAQSQLQMAIHESFYLPGVVIWTATARRASDNDAPTNQVLGPQFIGAKQTSEAPRWFVYTFRVSAEPANALLKQAGKHRLILEDHLDPLSPGAKGLGNNRLPLGCALVKAEIEPASLVEALKQIKAASSQAESKIAERVRKAGIKL